MPNKRRRPSRRRRRGSLGPLLRVLSLLLAAVAIVAALTLFFKVDQVLVTGNSRYTQEEIVAASGVEKGDNLILLDKYRISQSVYTSLPYISEVRINRKLPDTLGVDVTETAASAVIRGGGSWWRINTHGKLLEEAASAAGCIQIAGLTAQAPVLGRPLELAEGGHLTLDRLLELLGALESRGMLERTGSIDASDAKCLVLTYDDRLRVKIPYHADFGFKLDGVLGWVAELEPNERGTILMTLKDDNKSHFIPDP